MTESPEATPQALTFTDAAYLVTYPAWLSAEQADRRHETVEPWTPPWVGEVEAA